MRLRFTAEMIDDNGERVSRPIEVETAVPNPEEFGDKSSTDMKERRWKRAIRRLRKLPKAI